MCKRYVSLPLVALLVSTTASAVSTEVWKTQSAKNFRSGKLDQVIVSSEGEVTLGDQVGKAKMEDASLAWSVIRDASGNAFIGTGPKGLIFQVNKVHRGGPYRATKVFKTGKLLVTSLVLDKAGYLFAATIPGGKIYRVDTKTGEGKEYVTLPAKYIWSLVASPEGTLYAATGPEGKIFAVEPGGKVSLFHDSKEKHLLSLARDDAGNLYAGSSPKAILFKVAPDKRATAVHDFEGDEIRAIAVRGPEVFVAVNSVKGSSPLGSLLFRSARRRRASVTKGKTTRGKGSTTTRSSRRSSYFSRFRSGRLGQGTIYRIDAAGRVERLLRMPRGYFTSLGVDKEGRAYAGSGTEGRVYRVTPDRKLSVVYDFDEKQILALDVAPAGGIIVGTGNGAALHVSTGRRADKGTFFSQVFDARFPSTWGNISWRSKGKLSLQTRSGNTENPDSSWSKWSESLTDMPSKVRSPRARYLQFRVNFDRDPDANLHEVDVYYLQQNQRARVLSVTVDGQGSGKSAIFSLLSTIRSRRSKSTKTPPPKGSPKVPPQKAPKHPSKLPRHQPVRKVRWKVDNADGDRLIYWVYIKRQGSPHWILLNQKEPLTRTSYRWNTESVPDGNYLLRVRTSDERSNPHHLKLEHEKISAPVLVDNRKPDFENLKIDDQTLEVTCVARDSFSVLRRVEYSVDGGDWNIVFPEDGLLDDKVEKFRFRLRKVPEPGSHTLTLRAYDSDGNIGTANTVFSVR